jgi:hypothetical protein
MFTTDEKAKFFKGLVFGRPGVGKTHSAKTLPNHPGVLIISAEGGLLPLRKVNIEVWEIKNWKELMEAQQLLLNPDYHKVQRPESLKQPPLETIFIDSATELSKKCMEEVLIERVGVMAQRGKTLGTIFDDQLTLEDWGVIKPRIDRMFRCFRDMEFNVIFTALEHEVKDNASGLVKLGPLMYPQSMSEQVPGYFDEVFHACQAENAEKNIVRWWETTDDGKTMAKDRLGIFPRQIAPDWAQVFNAIAGGK